MARQAAGTAAVVCAARNSKNERIQVSIGAGSGVPAEGQIPAEDRVTVDPAEIERFTRIAETWWDPDGQFKPLHRFNPVRLGYIRDRMAERM